MKAPSLFFSGALMLAFASSSCTNYQAQGGVIGGLLGAGLGAAFGDDHQDVVAGAAVGTAVGVGAAAAHEQSLRRRDYDRYGIPPETTGPTSETGTYEQVPADPQGDPPAEPAPVRPSYPVAQRTDKANEVLSPYPPHHRIDVTGFQSGDLAKDPKNGRIFEVP